MRFRNPIKRPFRCDDAVSLITLNLTRVLDVNYDDDTMMMAHCLNVDGGTQEDEFYGDIINGRLD